MTFEFSFNPARRVRRRRRRHVLLSVLIPAICKGLNHSAEARRRLGIPRSTIYEQRCALFLFHPLRVWHGVGGSTCRVRTDYLPLNVCMCTRGVVCHSQVLAKYARPFVSDLLFWHSRHSALAANRIQCFCTFCSVFLSRACTNRV